MTQRNTGYALAAVLMGMTACAADADGSGADFADAGTGGTPECFSSNECPIGWTCSEFGTCVPPPTMADAGVQPDPPPPPPEIEFELGAPVSSLRYVYVAMTEEDALARIDGATLEVTSLAVGERPKVVTVAPGTDTAIVLDSLNATATVVRPSGGGDIKRTLATLPHLNQLVADPTGRYAVAWFDLNAAIAEAGGLDFVDGIGSFQDVTIIDLTPGAEDAVDLTVGFRPRDVVFDASGVSAYVITEDGVSIVDLAQATQNGPAIVPPLPVAGDPLTDPDTLDVNVTADGRYAVVRELGAAQVGITSLAGADIGVSYVIPLSSAPTDVDIAPDGTKAYAVLRQSAELAVIDIPADIIDPNGVEIVALGAAEIGSLTLSADGSRAILFTNASLQEQITIVELGLPGYPHQTRALEKSVRSVEISPDGRNAMIVHAKAAGDPGSANTFDEFIDRSHGYSVFDLNQGFAKLQITPVSPGAFTFAPGHPLAYVALDGGDGEAAVKQIQIIELITGVVRTTALRSPPDAVGVLPGAEVTFISQRHPLGRVSFIDIGTGAMRTITGFDLNSRIID